MCFKNVGKWFYKKRYVLSSDDLDKKVQAGLLKLEARTSTAIKHVQKSLEESLLTKFVTWDRDLQGNYLCLTKRQKIWSWIVGTWHFTVWARIWARSNRYRNVNLQTERPSVSRSEVLCIVVVVVDYMPSLSHHGLLPFQLHSIIVREWRWLPRIILSRAVELDPIQRSNCVTRTW